MGTTTLNSYNGTGLTLTSGGAYESPFTITNYGAIVVTSSAIGVSAQDSATLLNQGTIEAGWGVSFANGGEVTNATQAMIISTGQYGIEISGNPGNVFNDGMITSSSGSGVGLEGGGSLTNSVGGTITGQSNGVYITNAIATVDNAGTISSANYAVRFTNSGDVLEVEAGAYSTAGSRATAARCCSGQMPVVSLSPASSRGFPPLPSPRAWSGG